MIHTLAMFHLSMDLHLENVRREGGQRDGKDKKKV